ncbi:La domain containing protein [Tritrichomonas foetus]|uniref:La domain containing protein n=1 Tax=Tritrichomonas foetus TaxID=1144522 RepID=A0A1J4JI71_9EUKA|nr:La domain containing protein [Tritrichomonas foetus]|eukprot:OHS98385.1 La domain containing protein [Tritrichomonas foetus]
MFKRLGSLLQLDSHEETNENIVLNEQMQRAKDQIEYYLSGTNLERDKFFREYSSKDPERWIDVSIFMECQRIKQLGITSDDLLLACTKSHFLEVKEKSLRSKVPFVSDVRRKFRTVRMSGFPTNLTSDLIYDFLLANTAEPESVLLQYSSNDDGELIFNGSANIVYFSEYAAEAAIETQLSYNDKKIHVTKIVDYENNRRKFSKQAESNKKSTTPK